MNEFTKSPTTVRQIDVLQTLEQIYLAQDRLREEAHVDVGSPRVLQLSNAIDAAVSVVAIYMKLGRTPKIQRKHAIGLVMLDEALADSKTPC
jgi:hypothetical protein